MVLTVNERVGEDKVMLFPKDKMQVTTIYQGKTSDDGWLVLDFARLDTDGLGKVYIDLSEVGRLRKNQDEQTDLLSKTRNLLSLDDE
jgi:hypothetical protein